MHMRVQITGKLLASSAIPPPEAWTRLGNALRERIIIRTRGRSVDADGTPFAPYSDGYAARKRKAGATTRVTLMGIGAKLPGGSVVPGKTRMLDNMAVVTNATANPRVLIKFSDTQKAELMTYHMYDGRVLRKFFALSDDDVDYAVDFLRKVMRGL